MRRDQIPTWLLRWRQLLTHLMEYLYSVGQAVLHYAAVSMKPAIKDRALRLFFPPQTSTTMLSTATAMLVQTHSQEAKYVNQPESCPHPSGLRSYGAGGQKVRICDLCGSRWVVNPKDPTTTVQAVPKASPTAKTPLFPKAKSEAASSSASSAGSQLPYRPSLRPPSGLTRAAMSKAASKAAPARQVREPVDLSYIYQKSASELMDAEIGILHRSWEDIQERDWMSRQYDWENGEANWQDAMGPEEDMPDATEAWGQEAQEVQEAWEQGMAG